MGPGLKAAVLAATVLLTGAAAESAFAQTASNRMVASDENRWGLPKGQEKSFQWSNKGRWGVNVNVEEPVGREPDRKDVEAGAFFSINKQLRVGGTVRLDEKASERRVQRPEEREPRVRLETKFRF